MVIIQPIIGSNTQNTTQNSVKTSSQSSHAVQPLISSDKPILQRQQPIQQTVSQPQQPNIIQQAGNLISKVKNYINPSLISPIPESQMVQKPKSLFAKISEIVTNKLNQASMRAVGNTIKDVGITIKAAKVATRYVADTAKIAVDTIKGAGKLTPAYMTYRAALGNPVKPKEYITDVLKTGLGVLNISWRVNPAAPVVGAGFNSWKGVRQYLQGKIDAKQLAEMPVEGINNQPGLGEVFTDNVKWAEAIDIAFVATMFVEPVLSKKLNSLNLKAEEINKVSGELGVKPTATMEEISEAIRKKMKQFPDAFTENPSQESLLGRKQITEAYNTLKKAGVIEKKYAQAFDFIKEKLGIKIEPMEINVKPKELGTGEKPTEATKPIGQTIVETGKPIEKPVVEPLKIKGLDKLTESKIQELNVKDAQNPVSEGKVRVYQAVTEGKTTDNVFKTPEELASFMNNRTNEKEVFQYLDVNKDQVKPVEGKAGVFKIEGKIEKPVPQPPIGEAKEAVKPTTPLEVKGTQPKVGEGGEVPQGSLYDMAKQSEKEYLAELPQKIKRNEANIESLKQTLKTEKNQSHKNITLDQIERIKEDIVRWKKESVAQLPKGEAKEAVKPTLPMNKEAQTPVGTGKLRESEAYKKVRDRLAEETQMDVNYNRLNLEKDTENALKLITEDPKKAIRVGLGLEEPPPGQIETAISIALADKAGRDGDFSLQSHLEAARSLRQTRRGQEIVSERGRFNNNSPHRFIRELMDRRIKNIGRNLKSALTEAVGKVGSAKKAAMEKIDRNVERLKKKLKLDQNKIKLAQDLIDSLRCK